MKFASFFIFRDTTGWDLHFHMFTICIGLLWFLIQSAIFIATYCINFNNLISITKKSLTHYITLYAPILTFFIFLVISMQFKNAWSWLVAVILLITHNVLVFNDSLRAYEDRFNHFIKKDNYKQTLEVYKDDYNNVLNN